MSFNLVNNEDYRFSEGEPKATTPEFVFTARNTAANINANNCTAAGVYYVGSGSNLPNGNSVGMMLVFKNAISGLSGLIQQIFFDVSDKKIYSRAYDTGAGWGAWAAFGA